MFLLTFTMIVATSICSFADIDVDTSKVKFDDKGNPSHDEYGKKVVFGEAFGNGAYVYVRSDGAGICIGIENIEKYDALNSIAEKIKAVYLDFSAIRIEDYAFASFTNCKEYVLPTTVEFIGEGAFGNTKISNIKFDGNKGDIVIVMPQNEGILSDELLASYNKVVFFHSDGARCYERI